MCTSRMFILLEGLATSPLQDGLYTSRDWMQGMRTRMVLGWWDMGGEYKNVCIIKMCDKGIGMVINNIF